MCEIFFKFRGLLTISELDFIIVKIKKMFISWKLYVILVLSKKFFPIAYGGGIDLKSETDIAKDEVKWGKN